MLRASMPDESARAMAAARTRSRVRRGRSVDMCTPYTYPRVYAVHLPGDPLMTPTRKAALIAGALYLVTFVTSIPPLLLKAPILKDLGLLATGGQRPLLWAAVIEIVLAASCVGTAVALYPIVRPHGELRALGFVASRTVEAGLIMLGVVAMLAL
ncbi:MAG TPA: hypothetical protein DEG88_06840, partial [Propionibacteriaceae bacterium]|nr:hypothetical protein [Propionibacteriaceae bacterium]